MRITEAIKQYWLAHGQKTLASVLGLLALLDLTGYAQEITLLIGAKGYAILRLLGAAGIFWRAMQARKAP